MARLGCKVLFTWYLSPLKKYQFRSLVLLIFILIVTIFFCLRKQMGKATEFMKFFGKTLQVTEEELKTSKKQRNTGTKSTVLPETTKLLDKLYEPYNLRLAMLLNDDKWLYKR